MFSLIVPLRSDAQIDPQFEIDFGGQFSVNAPAATYFAISGARFAAARYCGRISVVFALSWIGGRGSFAVPGSMMKV